MSTALVFPGQGVQKAGMGKDLYDSFEIARDFYDRANNLLGFNLKELSFDGPQDELTDSKNAQPAILLHSYIIFSLIRDKIDFHSLAGHSLGEYTAYLVGGSLSFEDAIHLVRFRGELMSRTGNGSMSAVIGLDSELIEKTVSDREGRVVVANYNSPEQTVISGEIDAVKKAGKELKDKGARVIPLKVSGAFHSPLMNEVFEPFKKVLLKTAIKKSDVPVYSNVKARPVSETEEIRDTLSEQIIKPVRWVEIIENMKENGIDRFVEIGNGNVLSRLIRKTLDNIEVINISKKESITEFLNNG